MRPTPIAFMSKNIQLELYAQYFSAYIINMQCGQKELALTTLHRANRLLMRSQCLGVNDLLNAEAVRMCLLGRYSHL